MKETREQIENGTFEDYDSLIKQHVHKIIAHGDYQEIILTTLSKNIYDKYGNVDLDMPLKTASDSGVSAPPRFCQVFFNDCLQKPLGGYEHITSTPFSR